MSQDQPISSSPQTKILPVISGTIGNVIQLTVDARALHIKTLPRRFQSKGAVNLNLL